jgi:hypothetical protein
LIFGSYCRYHKSTQILSVGDSAGFIPDATIPTACVSRQMRRPNPHVAYGLSTPIELLIF